MNYTKNKEICQNTSFFSEFLTKARKILIKKPNQITNIFVLLDSQTAKIPNINISPANLLFEITADFENHIIKI